MNDPVGLILLLPPLLFALTFHEAAHGWMALRLGDPTAKLLGRLTLNPLVHLDPLGTLIFIIPPHIGWAKPVPVDVRYLKHPRRDMMWIALAGPVSNIILAFAFGMVLRGMNAVGHDFSSPAERALVNMVAWSVVLNLSLAAFNMIPIFPLDGSKVLTGLLSPTAAARFQQLEPIGPIILLGIILIGSFSGVSVIGRIISPVTSTLGSLFTGGIL
ncbi:MAG TPA: site-2 protease family protein [Candidatus Eisenbacteria bacterium]|nr:site-2 protease family protein [Candidatus Eisenbacteria bacterium]